MADIQDRITAAARGVERDPAAVNLIAVSKTFDAPDIEPVLAAGQRLFGENRVQEAKAKWPDLRSRYPGVELHLIGPLQSNKTREAVELFDAIHTVDRPKIAKAIAEEQQRQGKRLKLFVEVNTGEEPQRPASCRAIPQPSLPIAATTLASSSRASCAFPRSRRSQPSTSRSLPNSPAS